MDISRANEGYTGRGSVVEMSWYRAGVLLLGAQSCHTCLGGSGRRWGWVGLGELGPGSGCQFGLNHRRPWLKAGCKEGGLETPSCRDYLSRTIQMSFELCNAPASFQRCIVFIFSDMIEDIMEVFYGKTFGHYLQNLDKVLQRCQEKDLVLNWEKCHFMVREGIVLGHRVSKRGIKVDRAKIDVIHQLPPMNIKGICSFLGHAVFYRRFIKDFSTITRPLTNLLAKDVPFEFDDAYLKSFEILKKALVSAPIIQPPDWTLPFEIMCDASDFAVGAVLGQTKDKKHHAIC
uniref:Retrotransposon protein, putative, Ty3-gypsy sub-class n=2 Tax=Oryza sativa subsp. japonica TaxID=39947 RepID=Q2R5W4_ORYSJ|nr:retrotransposon protein, putative, Ty3-gypsy sub-class [Oryza sativa Japonica Group]ABA93100.1 retrotransposon protein, putative, Ty3-gypsy subclass [Oryza sativa Japonica Group]